MRYALRHYRNPWYVRYLWLAKASALILLTVSVVCDSMELAVYLEQLGGSDGT